MPKNSKITARTSVKQRQQGAGTKVLPASSVELANLADEVKGRVLSERARKNYAQNAAYRFFQRQVPGTLTLRADDVYGPDRWYALVSGGTGVQFARIEESPSGTKSKYACQLRQADATTRQFGFAQILEQERVMELRGEEVTLSFLVRTDGTEVPTVRAGLVEWTGTGDTVTSDIVSAWAATPTLIANAAFANAPADHTLDGTTYVRVTVTATLGTTFNNLILFIWTPNSEAQNDDFYVKEVQLVAGDQVLPWSSIALPFMDDEMECLRFVAKSYERDTAPGTAAAVAGRYQNRGTALGSSIGIGPIPFPVPMRVAPTVTIYSPVSGTSGVWHDGSAPIDRAGTVDDVGQKSWRLVTSGYTGSENLILCHYMAVAEL